MISATRNSPPRRLPLYGSLPLTGPRLVAIEVPAAEQQDALFQSLAGNEEHMRPRFYVPYESQLEQIRARAKTLEELEKKHPGSKPLLRGRDRAGSRCPRRASAGCRCIIARDSGPR